MLVQHEVMVAVSASDRTWPILAGRVNAPWRLVGYEAPVEEIFLRQATEACFDVAEMSLASYLMLKDRGDQRLTAIPVFLSRSFRHNALYVRQDSPLRRIEELAGKAVGFPEFQMTAAVWVRDLIRQAGVEPQSVRWVTYRPERVPTPIPARRGQASDLFSGLESGEVDAVMSARRPPQSYLDRGVIRRLLERPWEAEANYYQATHIFPIMHLVSVRSDVAARWPELPRSLYATFLAVKQEALAHLQETVTLVSASPWQQASWEDAQAVLGSDPWPYGMAPNWHQIEHFMDCLMLDGLLSRRLRQEEVFFPSVLDVD